MNIFNNGIIIGLILALIDIISMGTVKSITVNKLKQNWMVFAFILYGSQMLIFKYGLEHDSMTVLNLTWNIFSSIIITILGMYYFNESISNLEMYGVLFGVISLFLFGLNEFNKL